RFGMGFYLLENLIHIVARREIGAGTAQNDETDFARLARNGIHVFCERFEHVLRQRIQLLGAIQRQRRHTAAILPSDQIAHSETPRYGSTIRRRAPARGRPYRKNDWLRPGPRPVPIVDTP